MGNDSSVPILNMKTRDNWCCRRGTTQISKVLCYDHMKMKKAICESIRSYILDPNTKAVALKCLMEGENIIDKVVTFLERFYQQIEGDATNSSKREKASWNLTMETL